MIAASASTGWPSWVRRSTRSAPRGVDPVRRRAARAGLGAGPADGPGGHRASWVVIAGTASAATGRSGTGDSVVTECRRARGTATAPRRRSMRRRPRRARPARRRRREPAISGPPIGMPPRTYTGGQGEDPPAHRLGAAQLQQRGHERQPAHPGQRARGMAHPTVRGRPERSRRRTRARPARDAWARPFVPPGGDRPSARLGIGDGCGPSMRSSGSMSGGQRSSSRARTMGGAVRTSGNWSSSWAGPAGEVGAPAGTVDAHWCGPGRGDAEGIADLVPADTVGSFGDDRRGEHVVDEPAELDGVAGEQPRRRVDRESWAQGRGRSRTRCESR